MSRLASLVGVLGVLLAACASPIASPTPIASPVATPAAKGAIAYATETGLSPAYLVRPGDEPEQIAPGEVVGNDVVCPAFSPNGSMLALGMPGGSILVMSIDELGEVGDARRLETAATETPHCAVWAPDSSAVAFLDGSALVVLPLEGGEQRIDGWDLSSGVDTAFLTDYPPDRAVQWSPDGSAIALARPSGTWLAPLDGGPPRRIHETPAFSVSWSPDATRLVVGTGAQAQGALVIGAADGTTTARLPTGFRPPVWSPVGDWLAFSSQDGGVVVVRPDGTDRRAIDGYGYNVTWSPDGEHLMYIQDVSATAWGLLMAAADGTGARTTIVEHVPISSARSWPEAQQFSWQPVVARSPTP